MARMVSPRDLPASTSQSARFKGMSQCVWPWIGTSEEPQGFATGTANHCSYHTDNSVTGSLSLELCLAASNKDRALVA